MRKNFSFKGAINTLLDDLGKKLPKRKSSVKNVVKKSASADKKVLMFGWELPPFNSGGLGVACYEMAQSMAKQHADITFVLPKQHKATIPFMKVTSADTDKISDRRQEAGSSFANKLSHLKDRLHIREIDTLLSPYLTEESYFDLIHQNSRLSAFFSKFSFAQFLAYIRSNKYRSDLIGEVYRYGDAAAEVARKSDCDVIHAHDWLSFPAGICAKRVTKKPLVVHVHALEYDRSQANAVDHRICKIEKEGLSCADQVIAVSQYTKDRIVKFYGIKESKIKVVHNGINVDPNHIVKKDDKTLEHLKKHGRKIVLFVGRITYQKGVDYLIKAASKVVEHYPKAIFLIAGSGDMRNQIINQAASLGISDKVYFPGFLREKDLEKIYRSADVYVMPSVSEPFGIVALEAMVNGVPVILSKQSGAVEVVSHALKVDFWDTDELANKIVAVLKYPNLCQTLSSNGYDDAAKCSWDLTAEKCLDIYNNLSVA